MIFDDLPEPENRNPYSQYAEIFTDDFLSEIGIEFDLDTSDKFIRGRLYEIPHRFFLARRIDDRGKSIREIRKEFETLEKRLVKFQQQLETLDGYGIDTEIYYGAKMLPNFDPNLDSADYPEFVYKSSIAYKYEFYRYLNFLQLGIDRELKQLKTPGGRPRDEGLHLAVRYIANFWIEDLSRTYSLDYHEGSGITDAFRFTARLIQKIEAIEEKQIVTAMRTVIREDRELSDSLNEFRSQ